MKTRIEINHEPHKSEEFRDLRIAVGLSPKNKQAAAIALEYSVFAVSLRNEELIGMGRIIGDGGYFYQVVDISISTETTA